MLWERFGARRAGPTGEVDRHHMPSLFDDGLDEIRWELSRRYISGEGIEIGALHRPLRIPDSARCRNVDRMSVEDLREHYPELSGLPLIPVDVIDNGETLASIGDATQDFVIANHFIEHTLDPIGSIANFLRVLKDDGILFMAVPNKEHTFDANRPVTTLAHLAADAGDGGHSTRESHYREWATFIDGYPPEILDRQVELLIESDYSIHFHVFTPSSWLGLVNHCVNHRGMPMELEAFQLNGIEIVSVLRKRPAAHPG